MSSFVTASRLTTVLVLCFAVISWRSYNGSWAVSLETSPLGSGLTVFSLGKWAGRLSTPGRPHSCDATRIQYPEIYGVKFLSHTSAPVYNYSNTLFYPNVAFNSKNITNLNFCNVTLSYTHPGQNDLITVTVTMPLSNWNGRFVATGGGGFSTGYLDSQTSAVVEGYSSATTDGGHSTAPQRPLWGLVSDGNINYALLQDFASLALGEMVQIGKAVTASYYGTPPKYSYWAGCSTGGRQGLMVAQRYPKYVDGILAAAPAANWARFLVAMYWPQQIMNRLGVYPQDCEFDAITEAAIAACDGLDGLTDGILSAPNLCKFDASTMIGKTIVCPSTGHEVKISAAAAEVAQRSWTGPRSTTGAFLWHGFPQSTSLSAGLAKTVCDSQGKKCTGSPASTPFSIPADWISIFVEKRPDLDMTKLSYEDYDRIFRKSAREFESIISTNDPDLSEFRNAGGKLITYHGIEDELIFLNGTAQYYEAVEAFDRDVRDYYRHFEVPGHMHCRAETGFFPNSSFAALVDWVERGVAPDTLEGSMLASADGVVHRRPLCPYPLVAKYVGGDAKLASSFKCAWSFT